MKHKNKKIFSAGPISSQFGKENKKIYEDFFNENSEIKKIKDEGDNFKKIIVNLLSGHKLNNFFEINNEIKNLKNKENIEYIGHSSEILKIFMDKFETKKFLKDKGFDVTKGFLINFSENFYDKILNNLKFPVLIKEVDNLGGAGINILDNGEDLEKFIFDKEKKYLVEEFIYGKEYSGNIFVHDLNDNDILGKKSVEIFPPVEKGETGITEENLPKHSLNKIRKTFFDSKIDEKIREISLEIGKIEGVSGFLEVEFIYDEIDDKLKIIEINPRPSGTISLALESSKFRIKDFLDNLGSDPDFTNNLIQQRYCLELPLVHEESDFKSKGIKLPKNAKIFGKKELRKFKPYSEIYSISFERKDEAEDFLEKIEKK